MDQYLPLLKTILLPLIIGILVIYYVWERLKKDKQITRKGENAEGTIFDFTAEPQRSPDDYMPLNYPIIRFVTKQGEWITEKYHISHTRMKQGDKVQVTYNPANPREFYVHLNHTDTLMYALAIIVGGAGILFSLYNLTVYLIS